MHFFQRLSTMTLLLSLIFSSNTAFASSEPIAHFVHWGFEATSSHRHFETELLNALLLHTEEFAIEVAPDRQDATVVIYLEPMGDERAVLKISSLGDKHNHTWTIETDTQLSSAGPLALAALGILEETLLFQAWSRRGPEIIIGEGQDKEVVKIVRVPKVVKTAQSPSPPPQPLASRWAVSLSNGVRFGIAGHSGPSHVGDFKFDLARYLKKNLQLGLGLAGVIGPSVDPSNGTLFGYRFEPFAFLGLKVGKHKLHLEPRFGAAAQWGIVHSSFNSEEHQRSDWFNLRFDGQLRILYDLNPKLAVFLSLALGLCLFKEEIKRTSNSALIMRTPRLEGGLSGGLKFNL